MPGGGVTINNDGSIRTSGRGADGVVEIGHFAQEPGFLVGVGRPVNVRTLDHQGESVGVFRQPVEGQAHHFPKGRIAIRRPSEIVHREKWG